MSTPLERKVTFIRFLHAEKLPLWLPQTGSFSIKSIFPCANGECTVELRHQGGLLVFTLPHTTSLSLDTWLHNAHHVSRLRRQPAQRALADLLPPCLIDLVLDLVCTDFVTSLKG